MRMASVAASAVLGAAFFGQPPQTFADAPPVSDCVNALEQLSALQTIVPAYKQLAGDRRKYLDDKDRPAEIARIQKIVASTCSTERKTREAEQAAADQLHAARSPECAIERDKLLMMEKPSSRESADSVAEQRQLVADQCPAVPMNDVWLLQMIWARGS